MMKAGVMLPKDLSTLTVIPVSLILVDIERVPARAGVYLFFFHGGTRLLAATSYFNVNRRHPLSFSRHQHLYTGAAYDLRRRLKQHMSLIESSSMRRSLLALERERKAISRSKTPGCNVKGELSLTRWLSKNALVGIELTENPFPRERQLLAQHASPLNVTFRRQEPFARSLLEMRRNAFRSWGSRQVKNIRIR
jgi:hypothetical protein